MLRTKRKFIQLPVLVAIGFAGVATVLSCEIPAQKGQLSPEEIPKLKGQDKLQNQGGAQETTL